MSIKKLVLVALVIYVVGAVGVLIAGFLLSDPDPGIDLAQKNNVSQTNQLDITESANQEQKSPEQSADPAPECGQGGDCSPSQVVAHNSQNDCWVMYGSKVYDVTNYINQHPGGPGSLDSSTCGTDITAQMKGQASSASAPKKKNHPSEAYSTLDLYYIAEVSG